MLLVQACWMPHSYTLFAAETVLPIDPTFVTDAIKGSTDLVMKTKIDTNKFLILQSVQIN